MKSASELRSIALFALVVSRVTYGDTTIIDSELADSYHFVDTYEILYAESSARFLDITQRAGADVLLSNHTDYDGSKQKLPALADRSPGAPHPYVVGSESIERYLTVAHECALAALATVE